MKNIRQGLALIKELYILDKEAERFIERYPSLIDYLVEAHKIISEEFRDSILILEYFRDYECEDEKLFIVIKTSLEPLEAVHKENEIFLKWYIKLPPRIISLLNYTTEQA